MHVYGRNISAVRNHPLMACIDDTDVSYAYSSLLMRPVACNVMFLSDLTRLNALKPSDTRWRQETRPTLIQVILGLYQYYR